MNSCSKKLRKVDYFESPINFNFRGSGGLSTSLGGLLTLMILVVYFLFTTMKFRLISTDRGDDITSWNSPLNQEDFKEKGVVFYKDINITFMFKLYYHGKTIEDINKYNKYFELYQTNRFSDMSDDVVIGDPFVKKFKHSDGYYMR